MKEEILNLKKPIMVLMMKEKICLLKTIYTFLIFTNNELVIAYLNKEREKDLVNEYQQDNNDSQYALTETDFRKFLYQYGQRYYEMDVEDILKEDKRNKYFCNMDIVHIFLKACKRSDAFIHEQVGIFTIKTPYKKLNFTHYYRDWNRNIKRVLLDLYGGRIRYLEGDKALSSVFKDGMKGFY